MSKADELLRELTDAADVVDPPRFHAAIAAARAYLNEKPHEPPTDHLMNTAVETATTAATIGKRYRDASPPHAAAEPEKPVAWYMAIGGRHSIIEWGPKRPDRVGVVEWYPLYGSPSAQPIAREPPPDDSQLAGDVAYLRAKNDPRLFDIANQLIYCWAQDGLLSKAQAERDKFRDELAETKRPLDDQMRRLNDRVIELNDENLRLRRIAAHVPGLVYITAKERAGYGVAVLPTDAALKSAGKESDG